MYLDWSPPVWFSHWLGEPLHFGAMQVSDSPGGADMGIDGIAPLGADLWFERLQRIARGDLRSLENSLRHAFHLVQLTPKQLRHVVRQKLDEDSFEALLEAGNLDAAAICLLATPAPPNVSWNGHAGVFEAAASEPDSRAIFTGTGACAASATLAYWLSYLSSLRGGSAYDETTHRSRLEGLYARPQPSTLH